MPRCSRRDAAYSPREFFQGASMTAARFAVVAIGNAIVDIIGRCDDAFLTRHGAAKGSMRLVDTPTIETLYGEMGPAMEVSGGSAANTVVGFASFGGTDIMAEYAPELIVCNFPDKCRRAAGVVFGGQYRGRICLVRRHVGIYRESCKR
jgi:hypothetical protein